MIRITYAELQSQVRSARALDERMPHFRCERYLLGMFAYCDAAVVYVDAEKRGDDINMDLFRLFKSVDAPAVRALPGYYEPEAFVVQ